MSKPLSYKYTGTKGHIVAMASNMPQTGTGLIELGWIDISHPAQAQAGFFTYKEPSTGLRIRYDAPTSGAPGFKGLDHYHILNPNATSTRDMYLDANGDPVAKNSRASHILPKEGK